MKTNTNPEMRNSYLVQRLRRPTHSTFNGLPLDNMFAFGGGFVNGGMSKQGMDAIKDIFAFDYMGSAEFEFGAVPQALSKMVTVHEDLVAFTVNVETKAEKANSYDKNLHFEPIKTKIYAISTKAQKEEVSKRIKNFARNPYGNDTKGPVLLNQTIRKINTSKSNCDDYVGWLELDNAFMFFYDQETWKKMCKLLELV